MLIQLTQLVYFPTKQQLTTDHLLVNKPWILWLLNEPPNPSRFGVVLNYSYKVIKWRQEKDKNCLQSITSYLVSIVFKLICFGFLWQSIFMTLVWEEGCRMREYHRDTFKKKHPLCWGIKLYNSVPDIIKKEPSLKRFY